MSSYTPAAITTPIPLQTPGSDNSTAPTEILPVITIPAQRRTSEEVTASDAVQACRCGHGADAHQHFRSGSDCAACDCAKYRTTGYLAIKLAALLDRNRRL